MQFISLEHANQIDINVMCAAPPCHLLSAHCARRAHTHTHMLFGAHLLRRIE